MTDWSVTIEFMPRISALRKEAHEQARREQILAAAVRVWVRDGFDRAPVEAIAREAGLGKGTIYLYFETKEAVLQAVIDRFSLLPALEDWTAHQREVPPERAIPELLRALWDRLLERAPMIAAIVRQGGARQENMRIFLERVVLPGNALMAAYLDACVARGWLRPIDTFVAARALLGMLVVFLVSQNVLGGAQLRPIGDDAILDTIAELFLRGALPASR